MQPTHERKVAAITNCTKRIARTKGNYGGREARVYPRSQYAGTLELLFDDGTCDVAVAKDLSRSGIGFVYTRSLSGELTIRIPNPARKLRVRIARIRQVGRFYEIGAEFVGVEKVHA
jgi:hypothetical protein